MAKKKKRQTKKTKDRATLTTPKTEREKEGVISDAPEGKADHASLGI